MLEIENVKLAKMAKHGQMLGHQVWVLYTSTWRHDIDATCTSINCHEWLKKPKLEQNGCHFEEDIFKCILWKDWNLIQL